MNDYAILVNARNRALAVEPSAEQRMVYRMFQHGLDHHSKMNITAKWMILSFAEWYIAQPRSGEG